MARSSGSGSSSNSDSTSHSNPDSNSGSGVEVSFEVDLAAPAIVFAVFYTIMLLYSLGRVLKNSTTRVFVFLTLFCAIRVTTFALQATYEGSETATLALYTGVGVLYDIGIFALLYSTHALVLDRGVMSGSVSKNPISRLTSNGWLMSLVLGTAVILGVVSWVTFSQNPVGFKTSLALERACVHIFLAATVLLAIHAVFEVCEERAALGRGLSPGQSPDIPWGIYIPCLIVTLLLIRGVYRTVIITVEAGESRVMWYTIGTLPELLAVFLFAIPGLVLEEGGRGLAPLPDGHVKDPEMAGSAKVDDK